MDADILIRYLGEENNPATLAAMRVLPVLGTDKHLEDVYIDSFQAFLKYRDALSHALYVTDYTCLQEYANFFAPTLYEVDNPQEHQIANSWRKLLLERIAGIYPDDIEEL